MNAANEVAVHAFLEGRLRLTDVPDVVEAILDEHEPAPVVSAVSLERADAWARTRAEQFVAERTA
jgi:1-deoxy-D-xylulose-5-phosphate reductoisomerase